MARVVELPLLDGNILTWRDQEGLKAQETLKKQVSTAPHQDHISNCRGRGALGDVDLCTLDRKLTVVQLSKSPHPCAAWVILTTQLL